MSNAAQHARTALDETRRVVQGYRRASLGAELANATRVLAAAGIDARVERGGRELADELPESARQLLGPVVREAASHVLRHSGAREARLTLDTVGPHVRLELRSDTPTAGHHASLPGFEAIDTRLRLAGGALEWRSDGSGFSLAATVPLAEKQPSL